MQPWDQVSVSDEQNPRNGQAGLVTATRTVDGAKQVTVKMDVDGASVAFTEAQLRLLGR